MTKSRKNIRRDTWTARDRIDWTIEPWATFAFHRKPDGLIFRCLRQSIGLSVEQCAELLDVSKYSIRVWESGTRELPPLPFHVLRLLRDSKHFALGRSAWDGWQIGRDDRLYGPYGEYGFTVDELHGWWIVSQKAYSAIREAEKLREALNEARCQNEALREMFVSQGVVDELSSMQKRLSELMTQINTAKVLPFRAADSDAGSEAA